jgi:hypothetical protein
MTEKERREDLMNKISKLIEEFEDPTGHNCSNNVSAEIDFHYDEQAHRYLYIGGGHYDEVPFPENER